MAMFFANFKYRLLPHVPALFMMSQTQWQCSWTCYCNLQISTSATRASFVHDITDTQCQKQNGSSHGCLSANFKYRFFYKLENKLTKKVEVSLLFFSSFLSIRSVMAFHLVYPVSQGDLLWCQRQALCIKGLRYQLSGCSVVA